MCNEVALRKRILFALAWFTAAFVGVDAGAQEARARAELLELIQREKFDLVLPGVMRNNGVDMWMHVIRDGNPDPLALDLGTPLDLRGTTSYFIFTDRGGDRIERAVLGGHDEGIRASDGGPYDFFGASTDLRRFVQERDPEVIAVNTSAWLPAADGLSYSGHQLLVERLGELYASRLVSSEKVITDFRVRRVQIEIVAFANAGEMTRRILERALSGEVITLGATTREAVGWWVKDQLLEQGLDYSFDNQPGGTPSMPSVIHSALAEPVEYRSEQYAFQRGDLLSFDLGVKYLNFATDLKRTAYILREGETSVPADIQHAWNEGLRAGEVMRWSVRTGDTAAEALEAMASALEEAGFAYTPFTDIGSIDRQMIADFDEPGVTGVSMDLHTLGNTGSGDVAVGPGIAPFRPGRAHLTIQPSNLFAFEYFTHTALPSFGGVRLRLGFEDNAIVTANGVELLYPHDERILLIR